jgi:hypothetical protein
MKRRIIYLGFILFIMNACHNENNSDHNRTWEICHGIYVENYTVFGMGAGGGSLLGDCLTDSATFRVFVGIYDEGYEEISYDCQSDSLMVKFSSDDVAQRKFHTDSANYYSISSLKLLNNYSDDPFFRFKDLKKLATTKNKAH